MDIVQILVSLFTLLQVVHALGMGNNTKEVISAEKVLIKKLLERYERQGKVGRPVVNTSDSLTVYFGLSLIQILDVDETNQVLKSNIWYHYKWNDILLRWDPKKHDDILFIRVPSSKIWLPDIVLYNFADDRLREQRDALVVVDNNGTILWMPQAILKSSCSFDTLYFPFDQQTCTMKFGSWTYNGNKLNIDFVLQESMDMSDFVHNNEWDVTKNVAKRNVLYYSCCPEPYPDLTFTLSLKRKVAFYTFILVLPCALLSLLTLVIFWVPPESPAKLQLGMSVFVAFFFLLLVLADFTPRAAASIPLIGAYFCLSMVMITMSTVLACIVANMYFRGVRINRAPRWFRYCMVNFVARILCLRDKIVDINTELPSKKNWSSCVVTEQNGRFNDPEIKFAKVRLLDNGLDSKSSLESSESGKDSNIQMDNGRFNYFTKNSGIFDEVREIRDILQRDEERRVKKEERDQYVLEWRVLACIIDRLFFIIYLMVNIVGLIVLFTVKF
ncbi:hypothetical protein SNE40_020224 [Patella caerulea]|uniref:Uncharacterized protein n=2 Tax=Patella caerulea TaxID=87958 RepID=A0AAN8GJX2_PATCE